MTGDEVFALAGSMIDIPILVPKLTPIGLSEQNENLFFLAPSSKTLAEKTANLIIKELGFTSIAVLSPGYGLNKLNTDYFINECHQLGVDPVAIEWYVETPLDLSKQLGNIRRKAWDLIPQEEKLELKKQAAGKDLAQFSNINQDADEKAPDQQVRQDAPLVQQPETTNGDQPGVPEEMKNKEPKTESEFIQRLKKLSGQI